MILSPWFSVYAWMQVCKLISHLFHFTVAWLITAFLCYFMLICWPLVEWMFNIECLFISFLIAQISYFTAILAYWWIFSCCCYSWCLYAHLSLYFYMFLWFRFMAWNFGLLWKIICEPVLRTVWINLVLCDLVYYCCCYVLLHVSLVYLRSFEP